MKVKITNAVILLIALAVIFTLAAASPMGAAIRAKLLCATETGNCVEGWNGTDIMLYSSPDATGTPQFYVEGSTGAVRGNVVAYPTKSLQLNCKTNTITDTASYTATVTAITTPVFAFCTMNAITGDAFGCEAIVGSGIVTVSVKNTAATPAANSAGAAVTWCAGGTPQ